VNKPFSTTKVKKIPVLAIRIQYDFGWTGHGRDPSPWQKWTVQYIPNESQKTSLMQKFFGKKSNRDWKYYRCFKQEDVARVTADEIYTQGFVEVPEKVDEVWCSYLDRHLTQED
jgi:hypothetical protein